MEEFHIRNHVPYFLSLCVSALLSSRYILVLLVALFNGLLALKYKKAVFKLFKKAVFPEKRDVIFL